MSSCFGSVINESSRPTVENLSRGGAFKRLHCLLFVVPSVFLSGKINSYFLTLSSYYCFHSQILQVQQISEGLCL